MKKQRGLGAIAAIVVLVIMAALAAAITGIGSTQQITSAQDVMSARAWQAARAGNEWGLYQALKNASCTGSPGTTVDLRSDTGFYVSVYCDSWLYNEGETVPGTAQSIRVYRVRAVACPASSCPATDATVAGGVGYVERSRVVIATDR